MLNQERFLQFGKIRTGADYPGPAGKSQAAGGSPCQKIQVRLRFCCYFDHSRRLLEREKSTRKGLERDIWQEREKSPELEPVILDPQAKPKQPEAAPVRRYRWGIDFATQVFQSGKISAC